MPVPDAPLGRRQSILLAKGIVVFALGLSSGCQKPATCDSGKHLDNGQCVADTPASAPSASASTLTTAPSAVPSASTSAAVVPEKHDPLVDLANIIAAAKDGFRSVRGEEINKDKSEFSLYKTSLTLEGCIRPTLWKRGEKEWWFSCQIVPNQPGQTELRTMGLVQEAMEKLVPAIPADWKIKRTPEPRGYGDQFRATDPTGHVAIRAMIVPRTDHSSDADLDVYWYAKPKTD